MITVQNFAKSYGPVEAVKDVSFTAEDGSITILLGANGSGKTTTLRAIAGLLVADQGEVTADGISTMQNPIEARKTMGIFQDVFGLYERLTAREHIEYFASLQGLAGRSLSTAIDEVSERLQLGDILDRRTLGFSQGQRMKVALARAIVHKPKNIILDEPMRGLDVLSVRQLRKTLSDLRDDGHAILMSSHVMADVEILSDKIIVISEGLIAAEGTSEELKKASGYDGLEDAFVHFATSNAA